MRLRRRWRACCARTAAAVRGRVRFDCARELDFLFFLGDKVAKPTAMTYEIDARSSASRAATLSKMLRPTSEIRSRGSEPVATAS